MQKQKAPAIVSEINVTPMVDVMLVLLIIFMVITPLLSKGQTVEYAKAKNAIAMKAADAEDAILVAVTRSGETWLMPGNSRVTPDELPGKVSDLLTGRLDKTVYIKSDARAKYGAVEEVIDFLRGAGVDELGLLTEALQQQQPIE
jgi:biopolymer transport protein ExbD/biopolymer transport protein TolR